MEVPKPFMELRLDLETRTITWHHFIVYVNMYVECICCEC